MDFLISQREGPKMVVDKIRIKVWFSGSQDVESMRNNLLFRVISRDFDVQLVKDCDFLFVDYKDYVYHKEYLKFDCVRIFYSSENIYPDFNLVDYAICPNYIPLGDRFLWLPIYWWFSECWDLSKKIAANDWLSRENFCCFVVSNDNAEPMLSMPSKSMREYMFDELSKIKKIDSPGRYKQNVPSIQLDKSNDFNFFRAKIQFMDKYRFALVFENSSSPGYTTEKLVHALLADCIPIYWGDPMIDVQFNPNQFIWVKGEADVGRCVELVKKIDEDPLKYLDFFNSNSKASDIFKEICSYEYVAKFLKPILSANKNGALRRSKYYLTKAYESSLNVKNVASPIGNDEKLVTEKINLPLSEFKAHSEGVLTSIQDSALHVNVVGDYKGYVQTYGGAFKTPPKNQIHGLELIPSKTRFIDVSVDFSSSVPIILSLYLLQFNQSNQISSEFKETPSQVEGKCALSAMVPEESRTYKIAIRLLKSDRVALPFSVDISNLNIKITRIKKCD